MRTAASQPPLWRRAVRVIGIPNISPPMRAARLGLGLALIVAGLGAAWATGLSAYLVATAILGWSPVKRAFGVHTLTDRSPL